MAIDHSKNIYHTYDKAPKGRVVTFPDFVREGDEHLHPGMGNGGKGIDYLPAGKNCFDEWVGEPVAIAPPRRGPGRPRKDKYSRKPLAKVAAAAAEVVEEVEDGTPGE